MDVTAIIPARYASTRFPGKPLVDILGQPMIQRVYAQVVKARTVNRVIVPTDDERIAAAVRAFGGQVQLTRADHATGTDRLAEVAATLDTELVVNVQGDEPLIDPEHIDRAVAPLLADAALPMSTLAAPIETREDLLNPNVVKVVVTPQGRALYFSRAPIPWPRDEMASLPEDLRGRGFWRHIGLYVYRKPFLLEYASWPAAVLETVEKLEQLRVLERGLPIGVVTVACPAPGVDTPEDLQKVIRLLRQS